MRGGGGAGSPSDQTTGGVGWAIDSVVGGNEGLAAGFPPDGLASGSG